MSWLIPALLACLAVTDGGFCGFRDAAGRDARIFKEEYYRRATRRGLLYGLAGMAVSGSFVALAIAVSPAPRALYFELITTGTWLLPILVAYATLVLLALGFWAAAEADIRTLASVVILGPFTLIRPYVVAAAAALAAWKAPSAEAAGLAVAVCFVQLTLEPWMGRAWP